MRMKLIFFLTLLVAVVVETAQSTEGDSSPIDRRDTHAGSSTDSAQHGHASSTNENLLSRIRDRLRASGLSMQKRPSFHGLDRAAGEDEFSIQISMVA